MMPTAVTFAGANFIRDEGHSHIFDILSSSRLDHPFSFPNTRELYENSGF